MPLTLVLKEFFVYLLLVANIPRSRATLRSAPLTQEGAAISAALHSTLDLFGSAYFVNYSIRQYRGRHGEPVTLEPHLAAVPHRRPLSLLPAKPLIGCPICASVLQVDQPQEGHWDHENYYYGCYDCQVGDVEDCWHLKNIRR